MKLRVPFTRRRKLSANAYNERVEEGLDEVFEAEEPRTLRRTVKIGDLRAVVISDLHRGRRDRADDFERAEKNYAAAIAWYLARDYQLLLLGDVEELWENKINEVMHQYAALLEIEKRFAEGPGLVRFWGNHDMVWKRPRKVRKHMGSYLPDTHFHEGLRLTVTDGDATLGELFFAHGHQGTMGSEFLQFWSRLALRYAWRSVQNSQGFLSTSPAQDAQLRHKHDRALESWAQGRVNRSEGTCPVLIAGHTHHPVFPGKPPKLPSSKEAVRLEADLREAEERKDVDAVAEASAKLESLRARLRQDPEDPSHVDPPCYFNTGCCAFPDGDVTCIELADEEIRLVRWPNDHGEPLPREKPLAKDSLRDVFQRMDAAAGNGKTTEQAELETEAAEPVPERDPMPDVFAPGA